MRNIFGIAIATVMLATPVAVHAQGIVNGAQQGAEQGNQAAGPIGGIVGGALGAATGTLNTATGVVGGILGVDQSPRFDDYARRQGHQSYNYRHELRVGALLPGAGVGYYDVPPEYGAQPGYRYAIVNGHTVLVDRHNQIVQILD